MASGLAGRVGESEKRLKRVALSTLYTVVQTMLRSLAFILINRGNFKGICLRIAMFFFFSHCKFCIFL